MAHEYSSVDTAGTYIAGLEGKRERQVRRSGKEIWKGPEVRFVVYDAE